MPLPPVAALAAFVTLGLTTGPRLPGVPLRLGQSLASVDSSGVLRKLLTPPPGAGTARRGSCRFFGIPAEATLYFEGGGLSRAEFVAEQVSPAAADYVEDDLRRAGYTRRCITFETDHHVCDWEGRALVHLERESGRLVAKIEPAAPPAPAPERVAVADSTGGGAAGGVARAGGPGVGTAPPDSAQALILDFTLPGAADLLPRPVVLDSCRISPSVVRANYEIQGRSRVRVFVGLDGTVESAEVVGGPAAFGDRALECAKRWRFVPYLRNDRATQFWTEVSILFLYR